MKEKGKKRAKKINRKAHKDVEQVVAERTKHLQETIARLNDASRVKDEFIRITNHELRTPLDVIRGNIDMVLKGEAGDVGTEAKAYLQDAILGADRLTKLVNDMLDISRIETGRMKFALEEVDLSKLLKTAHNEFFPIAREKKITFHLEMPEAIPLLFSDRTRIFQIIDNLLGNALKFTPPGGSITIFVREEGDTEIGRASCRERV